jgi:hypothetical protein
LYAALLLLLVLFYSYSFTDPALFYATREEGLLYATDGLGYMRDTAAVAIEERGLVVCH